MAPHRPGHPSLVAASSLRACSHCARITGSERGVDLGVSAFTNHATPTLTNALTSAYRQMCSPRKMPGPIRDKGFCKRIVAVGATAIGPCDKYALPSCGLLDQG